MFSSITAVNCRAERYPHIGVPFKMKDLAAFLEIHMWLTRVTLFSFRTFCDTTRSTCVYLKRRRKRMEVRYDVPCQLPCNQVFFLIIWIGIQFPSLPPGSTAASVAYCTIPRFLNVPTLAARSLSRPQPTVAP